jgi:uncharacterized protein YaaN involved in tellurite resistance
LGRAAPFAKFVARFETVQGQIDKITETLLGHEHKLLTDIKALDKLYAKTLDFYHELGFTSPPARPSWPRWMQP